MVSASGQLEVEQLQHLVEASFKGLRIAIKGEGVTARRLLTGDFGRESLACTVRQQGRESDLVGTYWAGVYLVSERFCRSMAELAASGWSRTRVRMEGIQSPLWLLSITGRCGPLLGVGGEHLEGIPQNGTFIDPARWDGTDFFMAENSNAIFVLGSTAEAIQDLHLSNVAFELAGLQAYSAD